MHFFDALFLGIDAYRARDTPCASHGVMVGFGLEGRAGRFAIATEAVLLSFFILGAGAGRPEAAR